jgi:UPF0755 protein
LKNLSELSGLCGKKKAMRKTLSLLAILTLLLIIIAPIVLVPGLAAHHYGAPNPSLSTSQRYQYAAKILWYDATIQMPADPFGAEQGFTLENGASPYEIAATLEEHRLISSADAFITYLVYTGLDTSLLPGDYRISPALPIPSIAGLFQDTRASQIAFAIIPGWRTEEIAESLPTSGLEISPEEFLKAAQTAPTALAPEAPTHEGFLLPDTYSISRHLTANELIALLTANFGTQLTPDIQQGFAAQGLTIYQGIIIASIVEREAIIPDERATIASVYLNRLAIGQKLDADPTVQYAIGNPQNWWKSPLFYADLEVNSPYNTYIYEGLPPTPICNPSIGSLEAVAFPAQTPYFYFRARCDGSGLHAFAETFEEHLANGCE